MVQRGCGIRWTVAPPTEGDNKSTYSPGDRNARTPAQSIDCAANLNEWGSRRATATWLKAPRLPQTTDWASQSIDWRNRWTLPMSTLSCEKARPGDQTQNRQQQMEWSEGGAPLNKQVPNTWHE